MQVLCLYSSMYEDVDSQRGPARRGAARSVRGRTGPYLHTPPAARARRVCLCGCARPRVSPLHFYSHKASLPGTNQC